MTNHTAIARRAAKEQAADFTAANKLSPVISGYALQADPHKKSKGAVYTLKNGKKFRLGREACKIAGMPRWDI